MDSGRRVMNNPKQYELFQLEERKICSKCKTIYMNLIDNFRKDLTKIDGLYSSCKICGAKDWKENYPKIAEKHRQRVKNYIKNNKIAYQEYQKQYHQENKEKIKLVNDVWKQNNMDKVKAAKSASKARRRARKLLVKNDLTTVQIKEQYAEQFGKCFYCGEYVENNYHVDHIVPISMGGSNSKDNIVISCPECNLAKGAKTIQEFNEWKNNA